MKAEPRPGQRVRDLRRHAARSPASPDIAATNPPMPTFIWNINPEMAGHDNIFGTVGALCFNCIGQGAPVPRPAVPVHEGRDPRATASPTSSKQCATADPGELQEVPVGEGRVLRQPTCSSRQADLSADVSKMKQTGAQLVFTCIDRQRVGDPRQGDGEAAHERGAAAAQRATTRSSSRDNAQYLEGALRRRRSSWRFEYQPQLPETQLLHEVDASRSDLDGHRAEHRGLDRRQRVRHRLEARRARTSRSRS